MAAKGEDLEHRGDCCKVWVLRSERSKRESGKFVSMFGGDVFGLLRPISKVKMPVGLKPWRDMMAQWVRRK